MCQPKICCGRAAQGGLQAAGCWRWQKQSWRLLTHRAVVLRLLCLLLASAAGRAAAMEEGRLAGSSCCGSTMPASRDTRTACNHPTPMPQAGCYVSSQSEQESRRPAGLLLQGCAPADARKHGPLNQKPLPFSALTWRGWCWAAPGCDSLTGLCQLRRHKLVHLLLQSILRSSTVSTSRQPGHSHDSPMRPCLKTAATAAATLGQCCSAALFQNVLHASKPTKAN